MDLLKRMNVVVDYIENNLTENISAETLSKIAECSTHEFSHIFSFMAGMSVLEYIRRRRLSQAVFDIQNGSESLIDIALKYCYESQATFSRAFKELHGQTPATARKSGIYLKTYPKIAFKLIIKGVTEMSYRIEHKESFKIVGIKCSIDFKHWEDFNENHFSRLKEANYFKAPFYGFGAYFLNKPAEESTIIGFELKNEEVPEGYAVERIPATTWAVFSVSRDSAPDPCGEIYGKVVSEWFPVSNYSRNEAAPYMEVYADSFDGVPAGYLELWVPVLNKLTNKL